MSGTCINKCDAGYFGDDETGKCTRCSSGCSACSSLEKCTKCEGYSILKTMENEDEWKFKDNGNGRCEGCGNNCESEKC